MGKGVALEFKKRYPEMFQTYQQICREEKLTIGKLYLWKESEKWIMLFPTKKHWRYPSKLELNKIAARWPAKAVAHFSFIKSK